MKKKSTFFLQAVIVIIALLSITALIWFPLVEGRAENLDLLHVYIDPLILYVYASSIIYFVALYKAFKLLGYIGENSIFFINAVKALRSIKYCAIAISILIVGGGLYIKIFHPEEDDPAGFIVLCFVAAIVSVVVATAAAIFEKLLQNAIDIKSENELTI